MCAFFDNEVGSTMGSATNYNTNLLAYVDGLGPASLIDGVGGNGTWSCTP